MSDGRGGADIPSGMDTPSFEITPSPCFSFQPVHAVAAQCHL